MDKKEVRRRFDNMSTSELDRYLKDNNLNEYIDSSRESKIEKIVNRY